MAKPDLSLLATDSGQTPCRHGPARATYTTFGASAQAIARFAGQWREHTGDFYLLGAGYRAYRPSIMRFNRPDVFSPFRKGGVNAYAYCGAEPLNRQDPTGEGFFSAFVHMIDDVARTGVHATVRQTVNVGSVFSFEAAAQVTAQVTEKEYRVVVNALLSTARSTSAIPAVSYLARHSSGLVEAYGAATPIGILGAEQTRRRFIHSISLGTYNAQALGLERPINIRLNTGFIGESFRQWRNYRRGFAPAPIRSGGPGPV